MEEITPQEGWLNTSALRMHYLDWNSPTASHGQDHKPVVVALHGLASSCHWYDLVIPRLVDNYRCISLDQRGHGQTDQPPSGYDWHTLSTDVVEAFYQLGVQKAAVMGHSWGGYVALSLAAKYPESVSKLVMVDGGFMDWTRWPGATWEWFINLLKPRDVSGTREEFLDRLRQQLAECWSDHLEEIVMTMVRVGADGLVRDILEPTNHAQVLDAMWNEPPSSMFHLVRCPSMIVSAGSREGRVNSEFSRMRREMADAAQSAIGDCRVEWVPDTIHDIGYHKPEEMAKALNAFLAV